MELLQLRYFVALAKKQHLTKTAEELFIAPSSLSITIARLETELGVSLFDRTGRSIYLNDAGKIFLNYAEKALDNLEYGISAMNEIAGNKKRSISVSLTSLIFWRDFLEHYRKAFPGMSLEYKVMNGQSKIDGRECDFFLGGMQDVDISLFSYKKLLPDEQPCVICSVHNAIAAQQEVHMLQLKNEVFATPMDGPDRHLMRLCGLAGFSPQKQLPCDYFFRERALIENRCIAISTDIGYKINYLPISELRCIPITEPKVIRTQCIAWLKDRYLSQQDKEFIQYAEEYCANLQKKKQLDRTE